MTRTSSFHFSNSSSELLLPDADARGCRGSGAISRRLFARSAPRRPRTGPCTSNMNLLLEECVALRVTSRREATSGPCPPPSGRPCPSRRCHRRRSLAAARSRQRAGRCSLGTHRARRRHVEGASARSNRLIAAVASDDFMMLLVQLVQQPLPCWSPVGSSKLTAALRLTQPSSMQTVAAMFMPSMSARTRATHEGSVTDQVTELQAAVLLHEEDMRRCLSGIRKPRWRLSCRPSRCRRSCVAKPLYVAWCAPGRCSRGRASQTA